MTDFRLALGSSPFSFFPHMSWPWLTDFVDWTTK